MIEKLTKRLAEINYISKNILKYGFFGCLIVMITANLLLRNAETFYEITTAREVMGAGFSIMFEVVVGAILIDMSTDSKKDR